MKKPGLGLEKTLRRDRISSYSSTKKRHKNQSKREIVEFAVPADPRIKLKENEKKENTWTLLGN